MKFEPKSKEALETERMSKFAPFPDGIYSCEVMYAEDKVSKKGNDMIEVELNVYDESGNRRAVKDWLMPQMEFKLRHAAETFGLTEKYDSGELTAIDFQGCTGKVLLGTQTSEGYAPKNSVKDYVVGITEEAAVNHGIKKKVKELDDEIPW